MFTKIKNTREILRMKVIATAMVLALGITSAATFAAPAKTHAYAYPNYSVLNCAQERKPFLSMSTNSTHRCVKALQTFYKYIKGYSVNPYDGIYGIQTAFFTVAYQQSEGIGADGAVGNATWGRIQYDCLGVNAYTTLVCKMAN